MKLALSNFAWDRGEEEIIFHKISEMGIYNIECVLSKIKDWKYITDDDVNEYKEFLSAKNVIPYSIQSLFYNIECSGITDIDKIISHFKRIINYAKILDAKVLVFGSPNLRKIKKGWQDAIKIIFNEVDVLLKGTSITLAIEPNASIYGGDFFRTASEIVEFIRENDFSNIRTMIDTHNSLLENINPVNDFMDNFEWVCHVHVSEIGLKQINITDQHLLFSKTLLEYGYDGVLTYEVTKSTTLIDSMVDFIKIYK